MGISLSFLATSTVQKIIQDPSNYDFNIFSKVNESTTHFLKLDSEEEELVSIYYDEKYITNSYKINFAHNVLFAIENGSGKLKLSKFNLTDLTHIQKWENGGYHCTQTN